MWVLDLHSLLCFAKSTDPFKVTAWKKTHTHKHTHCNLARIVHVSPSQISTICPCIFEVASPASLFLAILGQKPAKIICWTHTISHKHHKPFSMTGQKWIVGFISQLIPCPNGVLGNRCQVMVSARGKGGLKGARLVLRRWLNSNKRKRSTMERWLGESSAHGWFFKDIYIYY